MELYLLLLSHNTTCQPLGWEQVTSRARLEIKVSWRTSVDRRPWSPFAQQPEGLAGAEFTAGAVLAKATRIKQFCLQLQDIASTAEKGGMGEAEQDCGKGTAAACSSPEESQALKDRERGRARSFV